MRLRRLLTTFRPYFQDEITTESFLTTLESLEIRTAQDLLFRYDSPDDLFEALPNQLISYETLLNLFDNVVKILVPAAQRGHEVLEFDQRLKERRGPAYGTGLTALDNVLTPVFASFGITEISGLPSSGKSFLALLIVISHLIKDETSSVLWIDTNASFSPERASQIVATQSEHNASDVLDRLEVTSCLDVEQAYDILSTSITESHPATRFIVIDSVTPLFAASLAASSARGHATMVDFMRHLSSIASDKGINVLLVNGASITKIQKTPIEEPQPASLPALGPSFAIMVDSTFWCAQVDPVKKRDVFAVIGLRGRDLYRREKCIYRLLNGCQALDMTS